MATQAIATTDRGRSAEVTIQSDKMTLAITLAEPLKPQKFTIENQAKVLQHLAGQWHITDASATIGASRQAFNYQLQNNPLFADAVQMILDKHLDRVEEVGLSVASQPTRDGFNDRKLFLQAYRRERFGNQVDITSHNVNVNVETSAVEIRSILAGFGGGK